MEFVGSKSQLFCKCISEGMIDLRFLEFLKLFLCVVLANLFPGATINESNEFAKGIFPRR